MNRSFKILALCAAIASLLAACGGGDDATPSNTDSALTVTAATDSSFNGLYSSSETGLSEVQKITRLGATDACEFTFNNLTKVGATTTVAVTGTARYIRDESVLHEFSVAIGGVSYATAAAGASTTVDRTNNIVRLNLTPLDSIDADTNTLVISGFVPMRGGRPDGC